MGGRKRKPTVLHKLDGTYRKDRHSELEPQVEALSALPEPPDHLSARAKRVWRSAGDKLLKLGVLSAIDLDLFASYCTSVATAEEITIELNAKGRQFVFVDRR